VDKPTAIAVAVAAVTGILSAGAFKFYEFVLRQRREEAKDDEAGRTLYRDDLIKRVEKLEAERTEHLEQIMQLMASVASLKVEVDYMRRDNEVLKLRIEAIR
jgi:uncharacterized coiled-coil DUF342 family protein